MFFFKTISVHNIHYLAPSHIHPSLNIQLMPKELYLDDNKTIYYSFAGYYGLL